MRRRIVRSSTCSQTFGAERHFQDLVRESRGVLVIPAAQLMGRSGGAFSEISVCKPTSFTLPSFDHTHVQEGEFHIQEKITYECLGGPFLFPLDRWAFPLCAFGGFLLFFPSAVSARLFSVSGLAYSLCLRA